MKITSIRKKKRITRKKKKIYAPTKGQNLISERKNKNNKQRRISKSSRAKIVNYTKLSANTKSLDNDYNEITMLEKKLKLNTSKCLPKSFYNEGLGFILDYNKFSDSNIDNDNTNMDIESEVDVSNEEIDSNIEDCSSLESDNQIDDRKIKSDPKHSKNKSLNLTNIKKTSKETNNSIKKIKSPIVNDNTNTQDLVELQPTENLDTPECILLRKKITGLINRLSKQSIISSAIQLIEAQPNYTNHIFNEIISSVLFQTCIQSHLAPDKLVLESMAMLSIVHSRVVSALPIGGYFVFKVVKAFHSVFESDSNTNTNYNDNYNNNFSNNNNNNSNNNNNNNDNNINNNDNSNGNINSNTGNNDTNSNKNNNNNNNDSNDYISNDNDKDGDTKSARDTKVCQNAILTISYLYCFNAIANTLVVDIAKMLVAKCSNLGIELLLLIFKTVGQDLRKENPLALKELIVEINAKFLKPESINNLDFRCKFMLETITAIKNNNFRKIPNYDPDKMEQYKSLIKTYLPEIDKQISLHYENIIQSNEFNNLLNQGLNESENNNKNTYSRQFTQKQAWLNGIMSSQRMNTDIRRDIFSILMTSSDYLEAYQNLHKLNFTKIQCREIPRIIVECCLQEKQFNPYYAFLSQEICQSSRNEQITFQYTIWDKLKILHKLQKIQFSNLQDLIGHLIKSKSLSISILKVINFTELDRITIKFLKKLLEILLFEISTEASAQIFKGLKGKDHLNNFRSGLLLFIKQFIKAEDTFRQCRIDLVLAIFEISVV